MKKRTEIGINSDWTRTENVKIEKHTSKTPRRGTILTEFDIIITINLNRNYLREISIDPEGRVWYRDRLWDNVL
jgi:hypothetical protein